MAKTDEYIGKHLLAGITYLDHNDNPVEQRQVHGIISRIDDRGIFFVQSNGEEFSLPPAVDCLKQASPGRYTLRSTGEVVENPDLLCRWTCKAPPPGDGHQTSIHKPV